MPKNNKELNSEKEPDVSLPEVALPKFEDVKSDTIKEPKSDKIVSGKFDKLELKVQNYDAHKLERSKEHQSHDKARVSAIDKLRKFVVKSAGLTEEEFNTLF
jgi:hypothetical protein